MNKSKHVWAATLGVMAAMALAAPVHAATVANFTFVSGTVTSVNNANAAASNVAPALPGIAVSSFTPVAGVNGSVSISDGTQTAYVYGTYAKTTLAIAESLNRDFTFSVTVSSPYDLQNLSFDFGGSSTKTGGFTPEVDTQVQIGGGSFTDLGSASASVPNTGSASNVSLPGHYSVNLDPTSFANLSGGVTVTFHIYLYATTSDGANVVRVSNIALTGEAVTAIPEPATMAVALPALALGLVSRRRRGCE